MSTDSTTLPGSGVRAALSSAKLLGFDTSGWSGSGSIGAKAAFVGRTAQNEVVTSLADDGSSGTLRSFLQDEVAGDVITFAPGLAGGTINLTSTLSISRAVTIDGGNTISISGQNQYGVFSVSNSSNTAATITNLNIENGNSTGKSEPAGYGLTGKPAAGGILLQSGALVLTNDTFLNNTATGGKGSDAGTSSMNSSNDKAAGNGGNAAGAVYVNGGSVTASNLIFSGNTATAGRGGAPDGANPTPGSDGTADPISNSVVVRDAVACFTTGTMIRTARGDVAVEDLCVGELAVTMSGAHRPIRWIGHRAYNPRFANANPDLLPICVKAGAIAEGVPSRDLRVSPKHALFVDGVLIPAATLVNGTSIVKAERVDEILAYWHVELDSHDVLIAENTPAESFVNDNGRDIFHNAATFHALYPDAIENEAVYCAPRVESGHVVDDVRRRLARRSGSVEAPAVRFGELSGHIDTCDGGVVAGWARDALYPDAPVCLDIMVDGKLVAMTYAEEHRPDLEALAMGDGRFGFRLALSLEPETAHTVEVRRSADRAALAASPWSVVATTARAA